MADHDDPGLERLVRASLQRHAGDADTTVPLRIGTRSHRRRWVTLGAAAALVAAIAAVTVPVVLLGDRSPSPTRSTQAVDLPTQWRTEYWHGISVEVPAGWAWGSGPLSQGAAVLRCGGPDAGTPYVGRPVYLSDLCVSGVPPDPTAPYVWFDAPLEPGVVELGNGYVQVTVERDGSTVTVGSDDDALRDRILSSVATQDLCPATSSDDPTLGGAPVEGVGEALSFEICAYTRSEGGTYDLVYGRDLGPSGFSRWSRTDPYCSQVSTGCPDHDEQVLVSGTFYTAYDEGPFPLTWVVDVPCNLMHSAYGDAVVTPAMKAVWADEGLRHVLPTFIGPLG